MSTLQQIRSQVYSKIRETAGTDTHFTDQQINGFINEGIEFSAVFLEYPRDLVNIQVQSNVGLYTVLSDTLIIRTAYFGDIKLPGNMLPLQIISEENLKELFPNWLDQTTSQNSRPRYLIVLDRKTISVWPRPSDTESASGKRIWINYTYDPAPLNSDSDVPDLPLPYHNLIQWYALSLVYVTLQNTAIAKEMWNTFMERTKLLKAAVTKETKEGQFFQWGSDVDVDIFTTPNITFP